MKKKFVLNGSEFQCDSVFDFIESQYEGIKVDVDLSGYTSVNSESTANEENAGRLELYARTHAVLFGELLNPETGGIALFLMLKEMLDHPELYSRESIEYVMLYLEFGIVPLVHAAGRNEKAAISEIVLCLCGTEDTLCKYQDKKLKSSEIYNRFNLTAAPFVASEIESLLNLSLVSTAIAFIACKKAIELVKNADLCTALNMEAIRGELGAFDYRLHEYGRPYKTQIKSAENIRRILHNSQMTTELAREAFGGDHGARCQDAICIRAVPQTHGGARDIVEWLQNVLNSGLKSFQKSEDPLLGYALDMLTIVLSDLGNISERRSFRLTDSQLSYGLPMNLVAENPGFNHGFPVVQAAATAILGELKLMALPSSICSKLNCSSGEYQSASYLAALKSLRACEHLEKILSIEMLMAVQGMDFVKSKLSEFNFGVGTDVAYKTVREHIKPLKSNRYLIPDLKMANQLISDNVVLNSVEEVIGGLR
ncbi:aromatic amino acid lyase [Acidaminobacter hydrogenoformans]|uniref:Histidine ammonia-lyase n=1 Tax=Acidaminobacter hydrogenoformans DSM 2784 TaxID=1120920 RepID=A0A1G5RZZ7_9FIRM|nr:aromatic amino acid lyase [Acidaminobacter hydrogenoformans]SCZ79583.1 histidine ammonia-lyase [Acidaminobacter hydrogenoformans DSM 2784]